MADLSGGMEVLPPGHGLKRIGRALWNEVTTPPDVGRLSEMMQQMANWNQPEGGATNYLDAISRVGGMAIPMRGGFNKPPFSKVMEGGKPKQVYHGTPAAFKEMDPKMAGKGSGGDLYGPSPGGYWTESPEVAGGYSGIKQATRDERNITEAITTRKTNIKVAEGLIERTKTMTDRVRAEAIREKSLAGIAEDREMISRYTTALADVSGPRPNIRPAFLDITKPFDIDKKMLSTKAVKLLGPEWKTFDPTISGETVYSALVGRFGSKAAATAALEKAGYNGITHIGQSGARQWIPFRTDQIHNPFTPLKDLP